MIQTDVRVWLEHISDPRLIPTRLERIGRVCYKSEDKMTPTSAEAFVRRLIKSGHESVLEHVSVSLRIECDRGVSHEIVRHRIGSYTQESTRYCNYAKDNGWSLQFIAPQFADDADNTKKRIWISQMMDAEYAYRRLINLGASPQEARGVLPTSLKTEIIVTYNLRQWRHFIKLRTGVRAHPQMQIVARKCLLILRQWVPVVFEDITLTD